MLPFAPKIGSGRDRSKSSTLPSLFRFFQSVGEVLGMRNLLGDARRLFHSSVDNPCGQVRMVNAPQADARRQRFGGALSGSATCGSLPNS